MPRQVRGFQIADGRFFELEEEADYEEVKLELFDTAQSAIQITQQNIPMFVDFLEAHPALIIRYCEAYLSLANRDDTTAEELKKMQEGETLDGSNKK